MGGWPAWFGASVGPGWWPGATPRATARSHHHPVSFLASGLKTRGTSRKMA